MEFILSWVKSGLLFGIFASVILMICPNKSYRQHIGMVVGLLYIMVMLHPLMELFQIDERTYLSYVKNYFQLEEGANQISKENLEFYEESLRIQLKASLQERGYQVKDIHLQVDENGNMESVAFVFCSEIPEVVQLECYIKNLFGEDVRISYEME